MIDFVKCVGSLPEGEGLPTGLVFNAISGSGGGTAEVAVAEGDRVAVPTENPDYPAGNGLRLWTVHAEGPWSMDAVNQVGGLVVVVGNATEIPDWQVGASLVILNPSGWFVWGNLGTTVLLAKEGEFTGTVSGDWSEAVTTIKGALDQLAARVTALE